MKLRRKNRGDQRELPSFLQEGIMRVNQYLIAVATFLEQRTSHYSAKKKTFLLLTFVIVFVTESVVIVIKSFKERNCNLPTVSRIKTLPLTMENQRILKISKQDLSRINRFKNYIDSLSATAKGNRIKDSLLHNRPQLMDSVNFLINLYLKESKTK